MTRPFSALQELGDSTRLSVFLAVLGVRKNVSQIVAELGLAQPQVSYHLRKLKDAELAVEEKDGRWVWYQANWDAGDRNLRDFIDLMARWAEDAGLVDAGVRAAAGGGGDATGSDPAGSEPEPVEIQPVKSRTRGSGVMRSSGGRGRRQRARPKQGGNRPRIEEADDRPVIERPKKRDSDMDDFLL
jgi:ArsR family transcriptional regulator